MISIRCLIGIHKWKYGTDPDRFPAWRKCDRCNKEQEGIYDMSTGDTIWRNLK